MPNEPDLKKFVSKLFELAESPTLICDVDRPSPQRLDKQHVKERKK